MPQSALIRNLNPVITGWSNYYSAAVSKRAYSKLDCIMYSKLRAWANKRHSRKSGKWVSKKYWQSIGGENGVFVTKGETSTILRAHDKTPIVRHVKVRGEASPYDGNLIYWSSRMGTHPEVTKKVAILLRKQKGKCTHCKLYFREEDVLEVDHIIQRYWEEKMNTRTSKYYIDTATI